MTTMLIAMLFTCQFPTLGHEDGYRGDETELRNFEYNGEYFLNLLAFSFDREWVERWHESKRGYRTTVGSVRSTEFYFFQELKVEFEPVKNTFFNIHYLQSEDFDSRYEKTRLEFRHLIKKKWVIGVQTELSPFKENDDLGFSIGYKNKLRLSYNMPDFQFDRKSDEGETFIRSPKTLRLQLMLNPFERVNLYLDVGRNMPMEQESLKDQFRFSYEKTFYRGMVTYQLRENTWLQFLFNGEETDKNRTMLGVDPHGSYDLQRESDYVRVELTRHLLNQRQFSAGLTWFQMNEETVFPNLETGLEIQDFDEETLYFSFQHRFKTKMGMRYSLYYAKVDDIKDIIHTQADSTRDNSTQIKLGTLFFYSPRKHFDIIFNPTFDLDTPEFDGGNIRLQALF